VASSTLQEVPATAQRIVDSELPPDQGAAHIWRLIAEENYDGFEDLRVWSGLASEWQEHPEHREALEHDIRDEARILLERRGDPDRR
jgi:hypothetical protein